MDSMDLDHDMDIDVDLVADEPIVPEPDPGNRSPGEIDDDADARCPSKVFIKGLDIMNPNDVKAYVAQHCSDHSLHLERIEWIDDNSANLLFASEAVALQALQALSAADYHISDVSQLPARQLLPAKPYSENPEVALQVRPTLESDKKQAGAASRSRFYLLNPEYDPEERRRKNEERRYRDRTGDGLSRRRGRQARADESDEPFDVNLYDDSPAPAEIKGYSRRRRSLTPDHETTEPRIDSYRPSNRGKELFPESLSSRHGVSRNRSASPVPDRDGDRNMDDLANNGSAVARERNRYRAQAIKSHISRQNRAKELFPSEAVSESGRLGDKVEDAATLLSKGITLPLMDGSDDAPAVDARKLADRVIIPGKGKLADRITNSDPMGSTAFNIRGVADRRSPNTGFAIKGSAGKSAKELFPDKFGENAGKELFGDTAGGRPRQRQRAGDLFD
ncbi:hypothetical protein F5B22DRAFT_646614 [Xylaria bambusicola]|uniref:uncharacterized protein n=1 Tax=Xylaria bambusicola TaxID=326684 RepID=UPI002007A9EB|nr:uncharacterized protein F5B22DRAFT_646614 [Xylaria bambusicola]KAI0515340.1 hypothetical protein F5B22DRAFT_646614 [Xylaria bambusicola]